ncbi:MAG: 16S rRNA (uracil(1498)-N(3))-methyltransferase [Bacillota bacterium]
MHRFFVEPQQFDADRPVVTGPDVKHMVKVLRLKPGDRVELLDGSGRAALARVESLGRDEVVCSKLSEYKPGGEPPVRVTLVQGLARGEKMDLIIQKCTELGVAEIMPMICSRSVVRLEEGKAAGRQARWQRVALEAAKQCRRPRVPLVHSPRDISRVLEEMPPGAAGLMPWEEERNCPIGELLKGESPGHVYIFIGPEGGFEPAEVEQARSRGVATVSLGPRILRTETAGLICLGLVMHRWGDLGVLA